jgi:hypothetical protein
VALARFAPQAYGETTSNHQADHARPKRKDGSIYGDIPTLPEPQHMNYGYCDQQHSRNSGEGFMFTSLSFATSRGVSLSASKTP